MKLHLHEKQVTFQQGYELLHIMAKNILAPDPVSGGANANGNATINEQFKGLPTLNRLEDVSAWFKGRNGNGR